MVRQGHGFCRNADARNFYGRSQRRSSPTAGPGFRSTGKSALSRPPGNAAFVATRSAAQAEFAFGTQDICRRERGTVRMPCSIFVPLGP